MIDCQRRGVPLPAVLQTVALASFALAMPTLAAEQDQSVLQDGHQPEEHLPLDQVRLETAIGTFAFDRSEISKIHRSEELYQPVILHTRRGDRLTGFLEPLGLKIEVEDGVTRIERDPLKRIVLAGTSEAIDQQNYDQRIILKNGDRLIGHIEPSALTLNDDAIDLAMPFQIDLGQAVDGQSIAIVSQGATPFRVTGHDVESVQLHHWSGNEVTISGERLASIATDAGERLAFRDRLADGSPCPHCPQMQVIPPGDFVMGSSKAVDSNRPNEGPAHRVSIAYPFAFGAYEITFDQWDACHADGVCEYRGADERFGRGSRPAISLSLNDAHQFLTWLSDKTGHSYRLPSEAEWEHAAGAGSTTAYYWGDEIGKLNAACENCGTKWDNRRSAPTGTFPANPFGLYDILGNAWEWTADCWNDSYEGAPVDGSAWQEGDCKGHAMRGGAWFSFPVNLRTTTRFRAVVDNRYLSKGLRVVRDF